jgi:hypothetical protein
MVMELRIMIYWSVCAMVCEYIYAKASPRHIMSQSGRKVSERSTKPPGFTIPCYFYMYNISSDDFAVIQTIRAEIYLFTMGTPYKINSRTLVLASSGEGFYHSNLPPPRRSAVRSGGDKVVGYAFIHVLMESFQAEPGQTKKRWVEPYILIWRAEGNAFARLTDVVLG